MIVDFNLIFLLILVDLAGLLVILLVNAIQAVLALILVFILVALLFMYVGAEFLAILVLLVYVGAVAVLFLFVVMMLNLRLLELYHMFFNYVPLGSLVGFFFFFEFWFVMDNEFGLVNMNSLSMIDNLYLWQNALYTKSNLNLFGELLYNYYSFEHMIIMGLLLLVAILGSIILIVDFEYSNLSSKYQKSYLQNNIFISNLFYWSMDDKNKNIIL